MKRLTLQKYLLLCFILVGAVPSIFLGITQVLTPSGAVPETLGVTLAWSGFGLLLAAAFGAFLSERFVAPIQRLANGIQAASRVDFGNLLDCSSAMPEEIAELTDAYNDMAARLQKSYSHLEERVAERTQRLSELNERMEAANVQLESQKLELDTIFACMADAVMVTDKTGEILRMNQAARTLLGTEPVKGSPYKSYARIYHLYRPDGKPFPFQELPLSRAVLNGETSINVPMRLGPPKGQARDLMVSAAPLCAPDGQVKAAVAVLHDVTALAEAERKIRQQNEELAIQNQQIQEASRAKGQFLANMSHELRTPLNAIIGFSQMLQNPRVSESTPKRARYTDNILKSGRHLLELVNDILDLSKIDAAKLNLEQENLDIADVISSVLELVRPLAEKKNLQITGRVGEGMPQLFADQKRLRQILFNLLSNAVKFTPPEGSIRIEADRAEVPDQIRIAVHDTGIGIAPEHQQYIFDEFYQVDNSYTRTQKGSGLGLSLTKKLVELHQGTIQLQSELGKGSTFTVHLPVAPKPVYVLLMEDHEELAEIFARKLENDGFEVLIASNGTEGLSQARNLCPDLIFLEMRLPDRPSFEILKALRDHPQTANIPVILMAGKDLEGHKDFQKFIHATIRKGDFTFQRLLANVRKVVRISAREGQKQLSARLEEVDLGSGHSADLALAEVEQS
jgi:signal transduction histidine kinase/CheY-like chemotaxis protein